MSNMQNPEEWEHRGNLISHLASDLLRGRLAIIVGAGISGFYGLPQWDELVQRLCDIVGEPAPGANTDRIRKVGAIRAKHFAGNNAGFIAALRSALYPDTKLDFEKIRGNSLLSAIGALAMSSQRGKASDIISLNYDDLLEIYLEYHGLVTKSIFSERFWSGSQDITVYHPHGFIPLFSGRQGSDDVVIGTEDYHKIMNTRPWRTLLYSVLRSRTFLHIGLSGTDLHMDALLSEIKGDHAVSDERTAFHGVRFALRESGDDEDDVAALMRAWGVFTHMIGSWEDIPKFLFEICQEAREQRAREMGV